jgi:hypothetical protein
MAQNVPNYVPTNGLVGWWPFNGNANDESGNGNHGTVNGASLSTDRDGNLNNCYFFNKNEIKFDIKNNMFANNFSISGWIYLDSLSKNASYPTFISEENNYIVLQYEIGPLNSLPKFNMYFLNNYNIGGQQIEDGHVQYLSNYNNWHYFTLNNKDKINYLYIDGILKTVAKSKSNVQGLGNGNFLRFGKAQETFDDVKFIGKLDDISIYNRALTDLEIKQLYEGCTKETATSTSFNSYVFTNNAPINLSATPIGGTFSGDGIVNNAFNPTVALLGKNAIKYNFKNTSGCADSTDFSMIMVDTLGNVCKKTINDTVGILKISFQLTTGIKANTVTNISVYPNPTSDVLIIDATDSQALAGYTYRILDVQGKQIYNAPVTSSKTEIALKTLGAKGVYVLHIVDANGISIENKKIVLQ